MHELIARALYFFSIHLLFASLVWGAAWIITSNRAASATLCYWIWVVTLLNFLLPLGALIDLLAASHLSWAAPLVMVGELANELTRPGAASTSIGLLWLLGASIMVFRLFHRLQRDSLEAKRFSIRNPARREFKFRGIRVVFSGAEQLPVVDGILRPRILLPVGINRILSPRELRAVLLHEMTHAKRRDNLVRLIQELALCMLWFHPFLWITQVRLALYRELSCDESVIRNAGGKDLISALAKLSDPEHELLMQASASSFIRARVMRLASGLDGSRSLASSLLAAAFGLLLGCGIMQTVAHTACCFVTWH